MAKKKSNFHHIRWNCVGLNESRTAEVLGVTVKDIQEWDKKRRTRDGYAPFVVMGQ